MRSLYSSDDTMIVSVDRRQSRLDALFEKVGGIDDLSLRAEFAAYLCVRVSAFVEQSVEDILTAYARAQSSPAVTNYVGATVGRTNLNAERLLQAVGRFDVTWREAMEKFIEGERKAALDSIISLRHNVAHGDTGSVSYQRVSTYYARIKEIVRHLESLCLE